MNYKFYINSDNKNEVLDEITRLSERKEKSKDSRIKFNKIYLQLNLLNNVGLNLPEIILKHLEDGLWELRPGRQRIIFYLDNNEALLLTIFVKRTNKYYQIYQKKRKGKSFIEEQIEICQNEINYFEGLQEQLEIASYQDGLEIKEELSKYGYLRKKVNQKKKKKINLYQTSFNGYLITWGKNNTQNDFLTFDYAKSNYTFFHAQKYHGSHVVVNGNDLDEQIIRKAANIAAYNSKGRYSSSVPVDYCLVKDVKKVKGAKAGFVTIRNQKTIYIDPEEIDLNINSI